MFSNKTKILYNLRNLYVDKRGKLHRYKEIKDKLVIFNNFKPCFLEHHLNLNLKLNKKKVFLFKDLKKIFNKEIGF